MARISVNCLSAEVCNQQGVFLIRAEDNSVPCWYYFQASGNKIGTFHGLLNFLPLAIVITDFGKVINSGHGENPPGNVVAQIANGDFSDFNPSSLSEVFCLLSDAPDGREFYTYLDVPYYLIAAFKAKYAQAKPFEFTEYGDVLESGWGRPTNEIIEQMRAEYGINPPVFEKIGCCEN